MWPPKKKLKRRPGEVESDLKHIWAQTHITTVWALGEGENEETDKNFPTRTRTFSPSITTRSKFNFQYAIGQNAHEATKIIIDSFLFALDIKTKKKSEKNELTLWRSCKNFLKSA